MNKRLAYFLTHVARSSKSPSPHKVPSSTQTNNKMALTATGFLVIRRIFSRHSPQATQHTMSSPTRMLSATTQIGMVKPSAVVVQPAATSLQIVTVRASHSSCICKRDRRLGKGRNKVFDDHAHRPEALNSLSMRCDVGNNSWCGATVRQVHHEH